VAFSLGHPLLISELSMKSSSDVFPTGKDAYAYGYALHDLERTLKRFPRREDPNKPLTTKRIFRAQCLCKFW
jgi:hypothetical protein